MNKWNEICSGNGIWSGADIINLTAYCAAFGRWHDAEEWLSDPAHGPVVTIRDDKGNIKTHGPAPQLGIAEKAQKEMIRLAKAIGL